MKGSLFSFNVFVAVLVLLPSVVLLYHFSAEINEVCDMSSNVVLYTIVLSCVALLSLMTILKELLSFE
ncbi:MAG: hypothetical protein DRN71_00410 [Candidatus Nanohalarchaeota archaeon]|nr:MAG: hypothetical protein DRN71_00410 [Candidatus Nanohaloarchaeota archaeon]